MLNTIVCATLTCTIACATLTNTIACANLTLTRTYKPSLTTFALLVQLLQYILSAPVFFVFIINPSFTFHSPFNTSIGRTGYKSKQAALSALYLYLFNIIKYWDIKMYCDIMDNIYVCVW